MRREGLKETPARFIKSLHEQTWGLRISEDTFLKEVGKTFEEGYDQMISVSGIWFTSLCEHHLAPFYGHATVAYIPEVRWSETTNLGDDSAIVRRDPVKLPGRVIGLSKLARITRYYAARPQVQERMTKQIADALEKLLQPTGVAVLIEAEHTCMTTRGVRAPGSVTTTTDLRGAFRDDAKAREEFLALVQRSRK
jgi:GTP cyclohydrolase I